jgi:hypothetical protein
MYRTWGWTVDKAVVPTPCKGGFSVDRKAHIVRNRIRYLSKEAHVRNWGVEGRSYSFQQSYQPQGLVQLSHKPTAPTGTTSIVFLP